MPTVHLVISGKVQGVFFRATAKDVADEIGVTGWVKNTEEGDVEIKATGDHDQLQKLVDWCKIGPQRAIVTNITITNVDEERFKNFHVIRRH
ncbi:MAG TPA: acylphosphatase [Flavisolibacter sp.]|nr:acylphosphatase [Flavisolibacter sp.]